MSILAFFCLLLAVGTYWGVTYGERSHELDNHIRRFLDQLDRERP